MVTVLRRCMHCSHVTFAHPQKQGGVSYPPLPPRFQSHLASPPSLLTSFPPSPERPHSFTCASPPLPLSLLTSSPSQHPSPIRTEFGNVVGWVENLVASIRIKIRIYINSPVEHLLEQHLAPPIRTLLILHALLPSTPSRYSLSYPHLVVKSSVDHDPQTTCKSSSSRIGLGSLPPSEK